MGATQVAGLEPGGIHHRFFQNRKSTWRPPPLVATGFQPGEHEPINVGREGEKWRQERQRQFPSREPFWQLMTKPFKVSRQFQEQAPVLPPRALGIGAVDASNAPRYYGRGWVGIICFE